MGSALSKMKKDWNFRGCFEAGVADLGVDQLLELLAESSDKEYSSVRHDIGFHTPTGQDRRFKVWISEDEDVLQDAYPEHQKALNFSEDSRAIGSTVVKISQGTLSTNFYPRFRANVALPARKFDYRLLIRTGQP